MAASNGRIVGHFMCKPLPRRYRVLPFVIPFRIPGFLQCYHEGNVTFAPAQTTTEDWFESFAQRVISAVGNAYLPVCRVSDGGFRALLGDQALHSRHPFPQRLRIWAGFFKRRLLPGRETFATRANCSSGNYSRSEFKRLTRQYGDLLLELQAKGGLLALHLSYGKFPFQEHFFPAFKKWMTQRNVQLTPNNYVPFYFVYALARGPYRRALLDNRRVLLVTGADATKRMRIEQSLRAENVVSIAWISISASHSFFDKIDVAHLCGKVDIVFVGAGVGKPAILLQLEPLGVPVLDVGFVFEVWADPDAKWERAGCVPDCEYDPTRVLYLPKVLRAR